METWPSHCAKEEGRAGRTSQSRFEDTEAFRVDLRSIRNGSRRGHDTILPGVAQDPCDFPTRSLGDYTQQSSKRWRYTVNGNSWNF